MGTPSPSPLKKAVMWSAASSAKRGDLRFFI